jgi:hypothetical protein
MKICMIGIQTAGTPTGSRGPHPGSPTHAPYLHPTLVQTVRNRGIWLLALAYFCVYIVRQGATSWLMIYLMQASVAECDRMWLSVAECG